MHSASHGRHPGHARRPAAAIVIAVLAIAGCGSSAAPSTAVVVETAAPSVSPAASPTPPPLATAVPPSGPPILAACYEGGACPRVSGDVVTATNGFFPGLAISIPTGWHLLEQAPGELSLGSDDHPDDSLKLWTDVRVVTTTRQMGPMNQVVADVPGTADALVEWFTTRPEFTVVEPPTPASIGGTTGTTFAVGISPTVDYGDKGCPLNPRCADFVTDPAHWGPNFYATGGDAVVRLYVAMIPYPDGEHLFVVTWDTASADELAAFLPTTKAITDSIVVPATWVRN